MKALLKKNNNVSIEEIETPKLDNINNVLIKVKLAGICRTDINVAKNLICTPDNLILGHEFCGEVVDFQSSVEGLKIGDRVTVNPVVFGEKKNLMCGVAINGAFAQYIKVPAHSVYKLPQNIPNTYGAYIEPIAASLAVLNVKLNKEAKGVIYGDNRISQLTYRIMKAYGFINITVLDKDTPLEENSLDFIVETALSDEIFQRFVSALKIGGTLVLKSRKYEPIQINVNSLVSKDIKMLAVNYGDFAEAIEILASGKLNIDDFIGPIYKLEEFEEAFICSQTDEVKKIFFEV